MCGIAGLVLASGAPPPDAAVLARLIGALAHRGPDGSGHAVIGRIALAQNRLAIIDLATGEQPMFAGPATLIANGEIYNYRELRAELADVAFHTESDCEPPLHLFRRDGAAFAEHLRGMYAIAVHDRAAHTVTLSRDPFGIKPLYIAPVPGGLAFASEPQALHAAGLVERGLRPQARDELLQMQFTTGADTIFTGIQRVLPGETLTCLEGHVAERTRRAALPEGGPEDIAEEPALERLDGALESSVLLHQRSDVPYGMFLSGGIDSSALLALMARLNSAPVLAFTAGWDVPGAADEREHAAAVARAAVCAARGDRDHRTDGLAAPAPDCRLHGRPGGGLRHHPDLVPCPARARRCQGRAVRRGRRRAVRRLWTLPTRDAAVVVGRAGHARSGCIRSHRRAARATNRLA